MAGFNEDLDVVRQAFRKGLLNPTQFEEVKTKITSGAPRVSVVSMLELYGITAEELRDDVTLIDTRVPTVKPAADTAYLADETLVPHESTRIPTEPIDRPFADTVADPPSRAGAPPKATAVHDDVTVDVAPDEMATRVKPSTLAGNDHATVDFGAPPPGDDEATRAEIGGGPMFPQSGPQRMGRLGPGDETRIRERYTLTRLHAKGGIGQVWLARDGALGREVALKELRPEQTPNKNAAARFLEEAQITGQLEHPGIVPVYELKRNAGDQHPFYTMRFIRGGTLDAAIREYHQKKSEGKATQLDLAALLNAFVAACNAVHYAHSRGVIHRDLKGQNIVLGDFGEVMVLDWGLAKVIGRATPEGAAPVEDIRLDEEVTGHNPTLDGQIQGTPAYMAPEQAEGRIADVEFRTDVYGLGAILYCILTGTPPFAGGTTLELLHRVSHAPPIAPRGLDRSIPMALEAICLKALRKRPEDRYSTAGDLALDVKRWLADEPVSAYEEPWTARAGRWIKRNRQKVTAAAALLVVGTVALGVTSVLVARERDEARRQRRQARAAVDDMYSKVADQWLEDRLDPLQKEFLEKALAYYDEFTREDALDPTVRLEHGRAYLRKADVLRKLGRHAEADPAYRSAIEILKGIPVGSAKETEPGRVLAEAETRYALSLIDRGKNDEAEPLLRSAIDRLISLDRNKPDVATKIGRAKAERALANLLRVTGKPAEAENTYKSARVVLEPLVSKPDVPMEARRELAVVDDGLGLVLRESSRPAEAEEAYRAAAALLEKLLADAPTIPGFRESLSKVYNSIGLLRRETGKSEESESMLRRQVALQERLAEDFPDRPEYRRGLGRSLTNLGVLQREHGEAKQAEETFRRALSTHEGLTKQFPEVVDYRRDEARCLNNLGELLVFNSKFAEAVGLFERSIALYDRLVKDAPNVPAHRYNMAATLRNLAAADAALGKTVQADDAYGKASETFAKLMTEFPDNPDYARAQAGCLSSRGALLTGTGKFKAADELYARAATIGDELITRKAARPSDRSILVGTLMNRGENMRLGKLPGAEPVLNRAIETAQALTNEFPKNIEYRRRFAGACVNQGEFLADARRDKDAETAYALSIKEYETVNAEGPKNADHQTELAYALTDLAKLRVEQNRRDEADDLLTRAVGLQKSAAALNPRANAMKAMLQAQLKSLAENQVALGKHSEAAKTTEEFVKAVPNASGIRKEAAVLLAKCVSLGEKDQKLPVDRRTAVAAGYADRAISLLRDAVDRGELTPDAIRADGTFAPLQTRDAYKTL